MAKRAKKQYGDGSLYQAKDGYWVAEILVNGKKLRTRRADRQSADDWRKEIAEQKRTGVNIFAARMKCAEYFTQWLEQIAKPRIRAGSLGFYKRHLEYAIPHIGKIAIADVTPQHLRDMYQALLRNGLSAHSVAHVRSIVRNAFRHAVDEEIIIKNPATLAKPPKYEKYNATILSAEDRDKILSASVANRYYLMWLFLFVFGLRKGELIGLKWENINWETKTLSIRQQIAITDYGFDVCPLKTSASQRTIPIPDQIIDLLIIHQALQAEERQVVGERWHDNGFLFPSEVGTFIHPNSLHRAWKAVLKKAGVASVRMHDLRHTATTAMVAAGIDIKTVQSIMGHSSVSTTLNIYASVVEENKKKALDATLPTKLPTTPKKRDGGDNDGSDGNAENGTSENGVLCGLKLLTTRCAA